jgi:Ca2+-binding EF-hand superfamily protein
MTKAHTLTAALIAALLATTAVSAAPGGDRAGLRGGPDFTQLDTDGDGSLTAADLAAAAEDRFARADTDADGRITQDEWQAAAEARAADRDTRRAQAMLERRDANGDGALTLEELTSGDRAARMLSRLDTDGDGAVSQAEFDAAPRRGGHGPRGGQR